MMGFLFFVACSVVARGYTILRMIYTICRILYDLSYQKHNPTHWSQLVRTLFTRTEKQRLQASSVQKENTE